jgi:hypothetical protein
MGHYKATDGTLLRSFGWTGSGCYNSGLAIGGDLLFQGSNGATAFGLQTKRRLQRFLISGSAVAGDPNFRDESLSCDTQTFASIGKTGHVIQGSFFS